MVSVRGRIGGLYGFLAVVNLAAWIWALLLFQPQPVLLGTALLAYGLGLRHAVDADHIAAIDNVTRKLMQAGQRPVATGLFFALGHSSVVILAAAAVAVTTTALAARFDSIRTIGGLVGTTVSIGFLLAIAVMNLMIFGSVWRMYQRVRQGREYAEADFNHLLSNGGFLARLFRPLFRIVTRSWHMIPLGFLFGLGFDTATEVALLGISATQAGHGALGPWSIMVFPALFAAGMALVDATDGVLMLGAYEWAVVRPMRKLYYNMTITLLSAAIALLIGGIEALGLVGGQFELRGWLWQALGVMNEHSTAVGVAIIAGFATVWAGSVLLYRYRGYSGLDLPPRRDRSSLS